MKIRVERDALADAVQWVARSLPNRPSVPILSGLVLHADANGVTLSSFDYETSAEITIPADVTDEGDALVSGRLLADISRSLPPRPVDLTGDDSKVEIVCGSSRFTLQTMPLGEYPALPRMPEPTGSAQSDLFNRAVSQVVVAAGRDELLPVLTGVHLEIEGERLAMLATDRYRMALRELDWNPTAPQASGTALVPARVLNEAAKSLTSGDAVQIALSSTSAGDGLVGFEGAGATGSRQTTARLLDGQFPKLRHLMDIPATVTVRATTADVIAAAKRVALVAERNTPLRMIIGGDSITLEAATGDQAQASEAVVAAVRVEGERTIEAAGFNPNYLLDALGVLDTPYVNFGFTAPGKPCLITGLNDLEGDPLTDYRHVIMLMRLPG